MSDTIIGHGMPVHPFAVIVAVLCGAALAGVPGIFLAIPIVAILSVGYRHWLEHTGSEGLVADLLKPSIGAGNRIVPRFRAARRVWLHAKPGIPSVLRARLLHPALDRAAVAG
jgi:hypothetical protein